MRYFRPLVCLALLPVPVMAQERPLPPFMVGHTVEDAVVAPLAQFVDHGWQSIPEDSAGLPGVSLPLFWYQPTARGRPLSFNDITTVKVRQGTWEDPYWVGGQLIQPVDDSIRDRRLPFRGQVLVDSQVPGGVFVLDSSAATRARVLSLLQRVFPDSFTRPDISRSKYLPRGSAPLVRATVQRLSPVGRGNPALLLVEAERCLIVAEPNDCSVIRLINLWLLDHGSRYQVLNHRGPIHSDSDFKSGSGRSALAWLELERRRFLVVECRTYTSIWTSIFEVLPTAVRQVHPGDAAC